MVLSDRLMMVISMIPKGSITADIGTDHGWVPIYLIRNSICPFVYAMDVRPGPLSQAQGHVKEAGFSDRIETRLSDGLKKLSSGEANAILIAGMGGDLIARILEEGKEKLSDCDLILSPHSEAEKVRAWLIANHFAIIQEKMVREDGKFYPAIHAVCRSGSAEGGPEAESGRLTEAELVFGPLLLASKDPVLLELLEEKAAKLLEVDRKLADTDSPSAVLARERIGRQLTLIEQCKKRYYHEVQ